MYTRVITLLVSAAAFTFAASAADWPAWRGPSRDGHAPPGQVLITNLPLEPRIVWKIKAGPGLASPVVAGGFVIHADAVDGKETVHAVSRETGKEVWRAAFDETFHDSQGPDGPRCTPLVDEGRVYAVSCRGQLDCLDLETGRKIWGVNYTKDFSAVFIGEKGNAPGATRHGNNSTPLIVGDRLYALVGGTKGDGVVCFDKATGKVLWKSQDDEAGYSQPAMARLAGAAQLLAFTAEGLIGLNPGNGALNWRVPIKTAFARHVTAPVWHDDVVVVSSHQVGMIGTKISRNGEGFKAEQAWMSRESAMNFSSPVAVGKHLYGLGPRKNLVCIEIATGKLAWSKDGYVQTSADKAYAGFIVLGENVLCLTDGGMLVLFRASADSFEELGTVQVCGLNWCNPAYADGRLYVRDGLNQSGGDLIAIDLVP